MRIDGIAMINNSDVVDAKVESLTEAQRLALSPIEGQFVYQTDETIGLYHYIGGEWSVYGGDITVPPVTLNTDTTAFYPSQIFTLTITNFNVFSTYVGASSQGGIVEIDGTGEVTYTTAAAEDVTDVMTITKDGIDTTFDISILAIPVITNNVQSYRNATEVVGIVHMADVGDFLTAERFQDMRKRDKDGVDIWKTRLNFVTFNNGVTTDGTDAYYMCRGNITGDNRQPMIVKLDGSTGAYVWDAAFDTSLTGPTTEEMKAGLYDGTDIVCIGRDFSPWPKEQVFMTKVDTSGSVQWQQSFGVQASPDAYAGYAITLLGTDYYVGGWYNSSGTNYGLLVKFNSSGAVQWSRNLANVADGWRGITTDGTDIYVCGEDESSPGVPIWAKYDSSGTIAWQRKLETGNRGGLEAASFYDGNVYFSGVDQDVAGVDLQALLLKVTPSTGVVTLSRRVTFDANPSDDVTPFQAIDFDTFGNMFLGGKARAENSSTTSCMVVLNDDQGVSMTGTATDPEITFDTTLLVDEASSLVDSAGSGVVFTTSYSPDTSTARTTGNPSYNHNSVATY